MGARVSVRAAAPRRGTPRRAPALTPDLESFSWPLRGKAFLRHHWGRRPFFQRGGPGRLAELASALPSFDIVELLRSNRLAVTAWYKSDGQLRSIDGDGHRAIELYRAGMTLYVQNVQDAFPAIRVWIDRLTSELGVNPRTTSANFFAQRRGGRTPTHFDAPESLTIQLQGRKRWYVAENRSVRRPTLNFVPGRPVPDEYRYYHAGTVSGRMPAGARRVLLSPGSVLYVPRGHWHSTLALDDSLALNFIVPVGNWIDLVLPAIRGRLLSREPWRETAIGAWGDAASRAAARARLADLLSSLPGEVGALTGDGILGAIPPGQAGEPSPHARYGRTPAATLGIETIDRRPRGRANVRVAVPDIGASRDIGTMRRTDVTMARELVPLCIWIARRERTFSAAEASRVVPAVPSSTVVELLEALKGCGLLHEGS